MTEKQKSILRRAKENAPLMSFSAIITFGVGAIFAVATFMKEFRDFKDQSLNVLEVYQVRDHLLQSDDVKANQALIDNTAAMNRVTAMGDSLKKDVNRIDSVSTLNATTIYQMKEDHSRFFAEMLRELKKNQ